MYRRIQNVLGQICFYHLSTLDKMSKIWENLRFSVLMAEAKSLQSEIKYLNFLSDRVCI